MEVTEKVDRIMFMAKWLSSLTKRWWSRCASEEGTKTRPQWLLLTVVTWFSWCLGSKAEKETQSARKINWWQLITKFVKENLGEWLFVVINSMLWFITKKNYFVYLKWSSLSRLNEPQASKCVLWFKAQMSPMSTRRTWTVSICTVINVSQL